MQLFVKTIRLTNTGGNCLSLDVCKTDTILTIKSLIESKLGIDARYQSLHYGSSFLIDDNKVSDYRIENNATIDMNVRLVGGAKKRKKKNYTTPKKKKRSKKKVKLATLRYYKVDDKGVITRLRRECTNAECGAAVFMAHHFDRQYCGKCGLTFTYKKRKN